MYTQEAQHDGAACQVLRDRVAMTCPELIDIMATEDL